MNSRILIVEDEIIVARDLQLQLSKLGYHVVGIAARGDEAIELTDRLRPDLVLMDIRLKGAVDGVEAAKAIRTRSVAIVFLTAHADEETLKRACVAEPLGYLLKPFEERELRTTIELAIFKHEAESKVRASERRYAATLASISDGVITTDLVQSVTYLNPAAERLTGWTTVEAFGKPLADVFRIRNGDTLIGRTGRECLIEMSVSRIHDDRGDPDGEVIVLRDVTEAKRFREHMLQDQNLQTIGRFAGGVAHDFNNLLTVILCGVGLLRADAHRNLADEEILVDIERAGELGSDLVRQILTFSRQRVIAPRVLCLNQVCSDTEKFLKRLLGSHIELSLRLASNLGAVKIDPGQLRQIILNLVSNARDAMPEGGRLLIETAEAIVDAPSPQTPPDITPGCYQLLRVTDTGIGMDQSTLARVYEPFFTTKADGKGSGLGLATVYGIVKQAGGHIWISSEVGCGTICSLYFPATSEPIASSELTDPEDMPRGTETILLVEDDEIVRNISRYILRQCGYVVLEAKDGVDAIEVNAIHGRQIDLVVTDHIMPRMTGATLVNRLQSERPGLKVLYITANLESSDCPPIIDGNRTRLLKKPFTPASFAVAVRELLDR